MGLLLLLPPPNMSCTALLLVPFMAWSLVGLSRNLQTG
jgi:hypothetical protein